jgi:hypothetical protein
MKKCSYCGKDNAEESVHCIGCGTSLLVVPEPKYSFEQSERSRRWGRRGLILSSVCVGIVVVPGLPLFLLPAGTPVRPMAWAVLSVGMAAITPVLVLPCVAMGMKGGEKLVCIGATILALTPFHVMRIMLSLAARLIGIDVEE